MAHRITFKSIEQPIAEKAHVFVGEIDDYQFDALTTSRYVDGKIVNLAIRREGAEVFKWDEASENEPTEEELKELVGCLCDELAQYILP